MALPGTFDDAVVGAGILGLATAYHLARRGRSVVVFERGRRASGASVRNFGMLWPVGQPAGPLLDTAMASLEHWREILQESGLWHDPVGSLHLAYHDDEAAVLDEFAQRANASGFSVELIGPDAVLKRSPRVRREGLKLGLFSPWEVCVDPREVIAGLPGWLERRHGVRFEFGKTVTGYDRPRVLTAGGPWRARRLWICAGEDFQTLYPEALEALGMIPCKLQMLRAAPPEGHPRIGPMLAAGLTLRHYKSFEECPSLPALRRRIAEQSPEFDRFGIHVMASQNGQGEVILGDSHEYGEAIEPFDKPEIDAMILGYLKTFLDLDLRITGRWHGVYAKHPSGAPLLVKTAEGVRALTGVGGAGMTLSFGLADQVTRNTLAEGD